MRDDPGGPDLAALQSINADLRRLREQVAKLTAERAALPPVPPALAAALACPPRSRPVRVRLHCHGRPVTAWVTAAGEKTDPALAWAAILNALPETPGATAQLSAGLPGITAIRDGRTLIVSTQASRTDLRACRTAGVAVIGGAAITVLRRVKTSSALRAGLGGAAAAAIVGIGALTIGHGHHGSGDLPPGALAPNVRGISSVPAARTAPGGAAPQAGSPDAAGALPRSDTHHQGRAPAAKLAILPSIPAPGKTTPAAHGKPRPVASIVPLPSPHSSPPAPAPTWTTAAPQPSPTRPAPGPTVTVPLPSPLPTVTIPLPQVTIPPLPLGTLPPVVHHVLHQVHHLVHQVHHLLHHLTKTLHHLPLPLPSPTLPGGL